MGNVRPLLVAALAVGVVAAALLWLDLRAASSETRAESQLSRYTAMMADGPQQTRDLAIYVAGDDEIFATLRRELERNLETSPAFDDVDSLATMPEKAGRPILLVEAGERDVLWTPVYSRARLVARIAYSSNGDTSWRDRSPVTMSSDDGPTVKVRGEFQITDVTKGVTSHRAYQKHLGRYAATQVSEAVAKAVSRPAS